MSSMILSAALRGAGLAYCQTVVYASILRLCSAADDSRAAEKLVNHGLT